MSEDRTELPGGFSVVTSPVNKKKYWLRRDGLFNGSHKTRDEATACAWRIVDAEAALRAREAGK